MMIRFCLMTVIASLLLFSCSGPKGDTAVLSSPNGEVSIHFTINKDGKPQYVTNYKGKKVIDSSTIADFEFKEFAFGQKWALVDTDDMTVKETWEMPWGEQNEVLNHGNQRTFFLEDEKKNKLNVTFRVYDDGVGFRYEIPKQEGVDTVLITDENTQFKLTGDHMAWWIPGDWDIYEHLYNKTKFSAIDAIAKRNHENLNATFIPENAVNTPVTLKSDEGYYLSFHEADLTNYAGMTLKVNKDNMSFDSELVGSERLGGKAKVALPFSTPWRTIQLAEKAGDLIESKLVLNLNEPNELGDVSYFTPMKYVGIWWEMHIGKSTWDLEGSQDMTTYTEGKKSGKNHGATTENAMKYIDFASENNIKGLLVEGWNTGWDKWINTEDREGVFDFMTPYPDYDFDKVVAYAKEKGVEIIMHHETSAAPRTYEKQMDVAMNFMKENGMNSVKTGYVGAIIPKGEYHHGQWMVNHYHKVLVEASKKKIAINAHEPIKATGKRRTYPNAISREGLRGQEFNAWASDGGNPPEHLPTVAFTRMLSGPIDFTPGVFNIKFDEYKKGNQVNTTLAQQLALYVVIYSPIQMVADLPEHYMKDGEIHPMFQFIKDVGVNWSQSKVLDGEVGEFAVIAREERETGNWFVGGITGKEAKKQSLNFDFLPEGETFIAKIYKDAADAHWNDNPLAYEIEEKEIKKGDTLDIQMAQGGGFAISLMK